MRVYSSLAAANLIALFCLISTCGCQNELATTKSVTSPPVADVSPSKARALDGSGKGDSIETTFKKDALVRAAMNPDSLDEDGLGQVTWEQDVPQQSAASHAVGDLMVDSTLDFESGNIGKSSADSQEADIFLQ